MRLAILLVLLSTAPARAAGVDATAQEREARMLHEEATRLFHVGDFDRAIVAYKRAHALVSEPALLFNIAQAYRAKRDPAKALAYYEAFLRADPGTAERAFVEARVAELRAPPATGASPVTHADRPGPSGMRTAGVITAASGAALLGAGLVFAVQAHGRVGDAATSGDASAARAAQTRAIVFTASGTVAMLAGGVMFYVGSRPVNVAPAVAPGAASLSVAGAF